MSELLPVRATFFAQPRTYTLEGDALVITADTTGTATSAETIPLSHISEIRLSHYPARFHFNRFRCEIRTRAGTVHTMTNAVWKGPVSEQDVSEPFRTFVSALCRRVAEANPNARFLHGRTRAALFVENGVLLILVAILIVVWVTLKPQLRWFQILNVAVIVLYAPIAIHSWRKNRAGTFDPRSIPADILPAPPA
jgi:hypothetical protein